MTKNEHWKRVPRDSFETPPPARWPWDFACTAPSIEILDFSLEFFCCGRHVFQPDAKTPTLEKGNEFGTQPVGKIN